MGPPTLPTAPVIGLIDDDASVLKALTRLLRSVGCTVVPFSSGEQFLDTYQHWEFDCLVLDVHFEGMSGLELEQHLTASGTRFPIVFITARDDLGLSDRIQASGQICLHKPIEESVLFESIQRVLEHAQDR